MSLAGHGFTNRLVHEKSPYLLQHAHNPVDWFPWGEEAFLLAKKLDKPIFLSIGYATCHWCHVMEKESFENPEIAALLNDAFVNIKVDREELPEVDNLYMEFAQALMSSSAGWPLNVVLTPDLKPFFAVTYLPPDNRPGMIGIRVFTQHMKQLWQSGEKSKILEQADRIVDYFDHAVKTTGTELPARADWEKASKSLFEHLDQENGGFKGEPKFPLSYHSSFLLCSQDPQLIQAGVLVLKAMHSGGIYDALGGGFSRYTIDSKWQIPHFEKMLYDNALLAEAYLVGAKVANRPEFLKVATETLDYFLKEMEAEEGGFFSAEDADSEEGEGAFYTWTLEEIERLLPKEEAELFCRYYQVSKEGNFEGRSVLCANTSLELPLEKLDHAKQELLKARKSLRSPPFKDRKVVTSYNGLMMHSLALAGRVLNEERYFEAALRTARFLRDYLFKEGRLFRRYCEKEAKFAAGLEDYAYVIRGLLTLFESGLGVEWLQWAIELTALLHAEFKSEGGAFYSFGEDPHLMIRRCDYYDGAEPSGNAVHCENLLRLYQMTFDASYLTAAEEILKGAKEFMDSYPPGACYHLKALQRYLDEKSITLVIALDKTNSLEKEIRQLLSGHFSPHLTLIWKREEDTILSHLIPATIDKKPIDGQTAVYACRRNGCEPVLLQVAEISKRIYET